MRVESARDSEGYTRNRAEFLNLGEFDIDINVKLPKIGDGLSPDGFVRRALYSEA
jgi:hypothetical protein